MPVFVLFFLLLLDGRAVAQPAQDWSSFVQEVASGLVEAGEKMKSEDFTETGLALGQATPCLPGSDEAILSPEARALYPGVLRRLKALRDLPPREPPQAARSKGEAWPEAECVLANASNGNWVEARRELDALAGFAESLALLEMYCQRPQVRELGVESVELQVHARCHSDETPDYTEGSGHIELGEPVAVIQWPRAANCIEACSTLETLQVLPTELLADLQENWLGCQKDGFIDANYERLAYLRDELDALTEDLDLLIELQTESALQIWGGTRTAVLYLPESSGGRLETIASLVRNAINETAAAGYIVSPRIYDHLAEADSKASAGAFKDAYDLYREAYREATAGSQRRLR